MHLKYRPDIDGLRTVAVLSVLIYHAEIFLGANKVLVGGFLGVDIFFVISGFLITSLILKELNKTGSFSITNFYERRARRLLPALFIVILVSFIFAWLYLIPSQFVDFSKSQISSVLFSSNFYWNHTLQEYGAESALLKPFLHTWSLAVEEQYYIVFPLILIALYKWLKNYILIIFSVLLIVSLLFAEWMTTRDASFSFYLLPSRFWELLAGGLIASSLYKHPSKFSDHPLTRNLSTLGFILISYSLLFTSFDNNHPGFITLTVVIGTLLIIRFPHTSNLITKILSNKVFVGIGLISYSLYLWHYPIFAFGRIINSDPTAIDKTLWFALSFTLSIITYYIIEKPARNSTLMGRRPLIATLSIITIIIIGINGAVIHHKGAPSRLPDIIANIEMNSSNIKICNGKLTCTFNEENSRQIFLLGDSHMMSLEKPLLEYATKNKYKLTTLNANGCQYIPNLNSIEIRTQKITKCNIALQETRKNILLSSKPSIVITGGRLPLILSESTFGNKQGIESSPINKQLQPLNEILKDKASRNIRIFKEYQYAVSELLAQGHKIIVIYPIPETGWDIPTKLSQMVFKKSDSEIKSILTNTPVTTDFIVYKERSKDSFALLDGIKHKNLYRIYPHTLLCDTLIKNKCVTHDTVNAFYRDNHHLSNKGTEMLMNLVNKQIDTIE